VLRANFAAVEPRKQQTSGPFAPASQHSAQVGISRESSARDCCGQHRAALQIREVVCSHILGVRAPSFERCTRTIFFPASAEPVIRRG
jgi:hypothetical protein